MMSMPVAEPPLAGPHERWCGRTGEATPFYLIHKRTSIDDLFAERTKMKLIKEILITAICLCLTLPTLAEEDNFWTEGTLNYNGHPVTIHAIVNDTLPEQFLQIKLKGKKISKSFYGRKDFLGQFLSSAIYSAIFLRSFF